MQSYIGLNFMLALTAKGSALSQCKLIQALQPDIYQDSNLEMTGCQSLYLPTLCADFDSPGCLRDAIGICDYQLFQLAVTEGAVFQASWADLGGPVFVDQHEYAGLYQQSLQHHKRPPPSAQQAIMCPKVSILKIMTPSSNFCR